MKTKKTRLVKVNPARYLIGDFLEMKTRLTVCEREMLMDKIEAEAVDSETLKSQPAFWMGEKVLLVLQAQPSECLFYYPRSGKMDKVRLQGPISVLRESFEACI